MAFVREIKEAEAKQAMAESKEALHKTKGQLSHERKAAKSVVKEIAALEKDIVMAKAEAAKALEEKEQMEKQIKEERESINETLKKAEKVQAELERMESEADREVDQVVGMESERQKVEREAMEAELKLKANLMVREELVLERIALRVHQVDWKVIGDADFDESDDLTKIDGIDKFVERKLNALEIISFEQISRMDARNMEIINNAIEFPPGRIEKQGWIDKATELMI